VARISGQEIEIRQINQPVAFLRQKDVVLSDDRWLALLSFNLTQHASVLTELEKNLHAVREAATQSTSIGETRQVEEALHALQEKLANIQRFLPRPTRKRGLLNVGGTVLKTLFGTATVVDLQSLHNTMDGLQRRQETVTHSLNRQLTYFRDLDETVGRDHKAIIDLSSAIRDFAVNTQESFQEVVNKLELNNKLRTSLGLIRQLEFALVRLETSLDQTLVALQFVLTQRVPANLLPPHCFAPF
jgi:hypothetical protein